MGYCFFFSMTSFVGNVMAVAAQPIKEVIEKKKQ